MRLVLMTIKILFDEVYVLLLPRFFFFPERPCFVGLTFKNRGQLGSRYIYRILRDASLQQLNIGSVFQ